VAAHITPVLDIPQEMQMLHITRVSDIPQEAVVMEVPTPILAKILAAA
jgi:hypothetical protein